MNTAQQRTKRVQHTRDDHVQQNVLRVGFSQFSIAVREYHDRKQLWEKGLYFSWCLLKRTYHGEEHKQQGACWSYFICKQETDRKRDQEFGQGYRTLQHQYYAFPSMAPYAIGSLLSQTSPPNDCKVFKHKGTFLIQTTPGTMQQKKTGFCLFVCFRT